MAVGFTSMAVGLLTAEHNMERASIEKHSRAYTYGFSVLFFLGKKGAFRTERHLYQGSSGTVRGTLKLVPNGGQ